MLAKNATKGERYSYAWTRIAEASAAGFYLEAITICESIVSDRLASFLHGCDDEVTDTSPFSKLIKRAKKQLDTPVKKQLDLKVSWQTNKARLSTEDLFADLDLWRKERNRCIHAIAKSSPGTGMTSSADFDRESRQCAREGEKLARLVARWHSEKLRDSRRATKP